MQLWSQHEAETTTVCSERIKKNDLFPYFRDNGCNLFDSTHTHKSISFKTVCDIKSSPHWLRSCSENIHQFTFSLPASAGTHFILLLF